MSERRLAYTWSRTWEDRPYDYSARDGYIRIGRVFRIEGGPGDGRWKWTMTAAFGNRLGNGIGVAERRDEACRLVEDHYRRFAGGKA